VPLATNQNFTKVAGTAEFPFVQTAAAKFGWGDPDHIDQFDQVPSSATGWNVYDGPGHNGNGLRTPTAVSATGGIMSIIGDAAGNSGGMGWGAGGSLRGRWEVAMKTAAGSTNYHPVMLLWPLDGGGGVTSGGTGGEIDFCEIFRADRSQANFFLHPGDGTQIQNSINVDCTQWHAWALEWTETAMTGFCDGVPWFTNTNPTKFPRGPMGLCLQLDDFGGDISAGGRMDFAWVKRWLPVQPQGPVGSWDLMFEDHFNTTTLNTADVWEPFWYSDGLTLNNTPVHATNVSVSGGNLVLAMPNSTSGACVTSRPSGSRGGFTLDRPCVWEARCLFPGDGTSVYNWSAFWILNDAVGQQNVEVDIAEVWEGVMQENYHCGTSNPSFNYPSYVGSAFHTYTLHRKSTSYDLYVDGVFIHNVPKNTADDGLPQYVLFNIGRTNSGSHNNFTSAGNLLVDYVRAWM
jgi:beta-glucanase (GH16 family)